MFILFKLLLNYVLTQQVIQQIYVNVFTTKNCSQCRVNSMIADSVNLWQNNEGVVVKLLSLKMVKICNY